MDANRVIVVGASEGGVQALKALIGALPEKLAAPVFIVQHIGAHESELPAIFSAKGGLEVRHPKDGESIHAGRVYVAPPDHHLIIANRSAIRLSKGPRENFARPSIDPLFRSAAEVFGSGAIGVILTGGLNDGTAGLYEIKRRGGIAIVQDPDDAVNPSMPRSALHHVAVDHCTPLALLPGLLEGLVADTGARNHLPAHAGASSSGRDSEGEESEMTAEYTLDRPIAVTCPDCGGALKQNRLGTLMQFRCHIGHVYTADAMIDGQFRKMEQSIEAALRSLNERAEMCREMAEQAGLDPDAVRKWRRAMDEAREQAELLQRLLEHGWLQPPTPARRLA